MIVEIVFSAVARILQETYLFMEKQGVGKMHLFVLLKVNFRESALNCYCRLLYVD